MDPIRLTLAGASLVLVFVCAWCAVLGRTRGQTWRFVTLLGYPLVTGWGQVERITEPPLWTTYALVVVALLGIVASASFMIETWPGRERGGSGDSDCSVRRIGRAVDSGGRGDRGSSPVGGNHPA